MQVDVNFAPPSFPSSTQPIALSRVHSVTRASVAMGEADVARVVQQVEELLVSGFERGVPALQREAHQADGFLPIASLLHYSPLGPAVWPFGGVGVVADCLRARGSMVVELSGDGSAVRKMPLRVQLRNQLEFLFSDNNYHRDLHLQLLQDEEGYAPLDQVVRSYAQLSQLVDAARGPAARRAALVREAVSSSAELVLQGEEEGGRHDGGGKAPIGGQLRRMTLLEKICTQVEWYLTRRDVAGDGFLMEQLSDPDGWVPISTLCAFPRMRKLCHPQLAAVAHVLSHSPRLQVSDDKSSVRASRQPARSPARALPPAVAAAARAAVVAAVTKLLGDASLTLDAEVRRRVRAASAPGALEGGGCGARIRVEELCAMPQLQPLAGIARHEAVAAARHEPLANLSPQQLVALLPRPGESPLVSLSADGLFLERLTPSPEARGLVPPQPAGASPPDVRSLMTFNLLADMLTYCEAFPHAEERHLAWPHRLELQIAEIELHAPSAWPAVQIGNAVYWRRSEFELLEHVTVPINKVCSSMCSDVTSCVMCNEHVPAHAAFSAACELAARHGGCGVVAGCDLNSIPGSGVHRLLTSGSLPHSHPHMAAAIVAEHVAFPSLGPPPPSDSACGGERAVTLPRAFTSAYAAVLGDEPLFTNFTGPQRPPCQFVGTLDYVLCSSHLAPARVLQLPSEDTVRLGRFLPSERFPSDHLPLLAHLNFAQGAPAGAASAADVASPRSATAAMLGERLTLSTQLERRSVEAPEDYRSSASLVRQASFHKPIAALPHGFSERTDVTSESSARSTPEGSPNLRAAAARQLMPPPGAVSPKRKAAGSDVDRPRSAGESNGQC
ncbi:hypothetical protein EMIHUDRAFT_449888 [Emiliania huxleyi CCMP1516]|uniref:HTH La-type RNA-binding domain-containing protein n=2 Tax=Emiliania huxleyi TaxID=2903 RepID=A0A0D3K0T6_EMIH1|nr:hypothetical protein EMIHUDRAFT_449888 [Emiliania huxleyi CCMP1516]EOD29371.1 hypothetical protein EMIHUDRAFT_449888 [Emiliania huxleyi CCMP1516]|eukprot:XP_005781800.1 hypothetical protein EMIHUDRAFT_449888 [Emiliania huxleyi CCMP1516]